jgi:hypothetical protein
MGQSKGGHRHLQIGRMLDIDLISEPPPPPPPRCMHPKCGNLRGQRGRKRFVASWGLWMSHICPCTPCPSPPRVEVKGRNSSFCPPLGQRRVHPIFIPPRLCFPFRTIQEFHMPKQMISHPKLPGINIYI